MAKIDGNKTNTTAIIGILFGVLVYALKDAWLAVSGSIIIYSIFQYTKRDATKKTENKLEDIKNKEFKVVPSITQK
jgi:glycopeptide antibiotics resistance protein